ncbi:MAG: DNA mismatch endonuclease Vsr [Paludibacteraceae bacterium]|jgi:DNA mismatch endonuclease Vsr|nr:DNA mismatch endonuclease Vsr [Paludibacteraceae bacterium]
MDKITPEQRSKTMSRIHSKNTRPELIVRKFLYANGFRYRLNVRSLPGTPDIVLKKYHTAIFINGCFWHGHVCQQGRMPKSNVAFWENKITRNKERDEEVRDKLRAIGWRTMVVWECQLKPAVRQQTLEGIVYLLNEAFLDLYRKKSAVIPYYGSNPDAEQRMVAEETPQYGKND